jgi:hypothetical protein
MEILTKNGCTPVITGIWEFEAGLLRIQGQSWL